jgi:hypothetical protein
MPKCNRCGAFVEYAAKACAWCGAGGDNGSAGSFVVPRTGVKTPPFALAEAGAASAAAFPPIAGASLAVNQKNLQGIGGWLTIFALDLALGPFAYLFAIGANFLLSSSPAGKSLLAEYPGVGGLLLLNSAIDALFIVALVFLNFQFYAKRKTFPHLAIGYLVASFILQIAVQRMILQYMPAYPSWAAFGSLASAGFWIPYFLLSRRVRQTFVN